VRPHSNLPLRTHIHARTRPHAHPTPSSPKPGAGDWGAKARARWSCPTRRGHRGHQGRGGGAHSGQDRFPRPSLSASPPPSLQPSPSVYTDQPRPGGPLRLPGGRMRSANAAPVGFLLNCRAETAAAAAGRRHRRNRRPAPRALYPPRTLAPSPGRAARSHPRALPRPHTHREPEPRRPGQRAAARFSAKVKKLRRQTKPVRHNNICKQNPAAAASGAQGPGPRPAPLWPPTPCSRPQPQPSTPPSPQWRTRGVVYTVPKTRTAGRTHNIGVKNKWGGA
jgi:hypothetical protein